MVTDAFVGFDVTTSRPAAAARGAGAGVDAGREGGMPVGAADGGAEASGGEGFPVATICSVAALGVDEPVVGACAPGEDWPDGEGEAGR